MNRTVFLVIVAVIFYFAGAMYPSIARKVGVA